MSLSSLFEKWDTIAYLIYNFINRVAYLFSDKKILKKNIYLKDLHFGERCFILMSGPSLKDHDLSLLKNEITFCTNHFNRTEAYELVQPDYHCALDRGFFDIHDNPDQKFELEDLIRKNVASKFIFHRHYLKNFDLQKNVYVTHPKHFPNIFGVKNKLHSVTSNFANISFFAINCAIYMGFKEIYILGLDFEPGVFDHFYQKEGHELDKKNSQVFETEKAKICERYWGYNLAQWHSYYLAEFAKKEKVKIYNANSSSYVRAFEFKQFNEIPHLPN